MENTNKYRVEFVINDVFTEEGYYQLVRERDDAILVSGNYDKIKIIVIDRGIADSTIWL